MKTVTVRELQYHFSRIQEGLKNEKRIGVTRRGAVIAEVVAPKTSDNANRMFTE
jgi:antitoxin (DNA-binding transcriptional repressor) of toxin-antitoxin stability system